MISKGTSRNPVICSNYSQTNTTASWLPNYHGWFYIVFFKSFKSRKKLLGMMVVLHKVMGFFFSLLFYLYKFHAFWVLFFITIQKILCTILSTLNIYCLLVRKIYLVSQSIDISWYLSFNDIWSWIFE